MGAAQLLLAVENVNPHISDINGWDASCVATREGQMEIVDLLLALPYTGQSINEMKEPLIENRKVEKQSDFHGHNLYSHALRGKRRHHKDETDNCNILLNLHKSEPDEDMKNLFASHHGCTSISQLLTHMAGSPSVITKQSAP